ncbi:MAG TPA: circadian clock KaiB family protein [Bacteroidales bacterium]|nr:circadian clock KaiB family protein [Bacteroidales bacterium]
MKKKKPLSAESRIEAAIRGISNEKYLLKLYVTGSTTNSVKAISNIKEICEKHLKGRYDLQIIDLYKQPELASSEQIIAAPTLIRKLPLPLRRIIGDLSGTERVLAGLDIIEVKQK